MNIAIGKLGRSIKFKRKNWKDGAGNNEPAILIQKLAELNPGYKYYVVGKNDLKSLDEDELKQIAPNNNIIDAWENFDSKTDDIEMYPYNQTKNVKFAYGIIIGGISASVNITNKFFKNNKETGLPDKEMGLIKPLNMFHSYAAPIINFLNITNIPWVFFTSDSRQVPIAARDLTNREIATLGTMSFDYESTYFSGEGFNGQDLTTDKKHSYYAGGELISLLDNNVSPYNNEEKDITIGFFFHKYNDKKRSKAIKSYIDEFDDNTIEVYGKWKEELEEGDKRFKGSLSFDETQEMMKHTKYTLCYPIIDGDISAKWVEAARACVIPFFAPGYDRNREIQEGLQFPSFLYVNSPEDFKEKINKLESDNDFYNQIKKIVINGYEAANKNLINYYQVEINNLITYKDKVFK